MRVQMHFPSGLSLPKLGDLHTLGENRPERDVEIVSLQCRFSITDWTINPRNEPVMAECAYREHSARRQSREIVALPHHRW